MSTPEDNPADEAPDERTAADYEECGGCRHYPAYCPPGGTGCIAWDSEQADGKCKCPGRTKKVAPAPAVSRALEYDADEV